MRGKRLRDKEIKVGKEKKKQINRIREWKDKQKSKTCVDKINWLAIDFELYREFIFPIDWCCFYYFVRNSLVALLLDYF